MAKTSLFELVGGLNTLKKVHKTFYDKVYAHPWLGQFFEGHDQQAIEDRQTSFMAVKMGGDVNYPGRQPLMSHRAMYITEELFELRSNILRESLQEENVAEELIEKWLRIDNAFKKQIVKKDIQSFYATSWKYEKRIIIPKPLEN